MHSPIFINHNHHEESGSELFVYFSLPFYPRKQKTYFYHGHMALGMDDKIYQVYNPRMLKSDFILSVMPSRFWFYDKIRNWVDRDKTSPTYGYVSLYSACETERTRVFYIRFKDINSHNLEKHKNFLGRLNDQYNNKEIDFSVLKNNCVGMIGRIFYDEGILEKRGLNFLPFIVFKRMIEKGMKNNRKFEAGTVEGKMNENFELHRFCLGLPTLSPENHILRMLETLNGSIQNNSAEKYNAVD